MTKPLPMMRMLSIVLLGVVSLLGSVSTSSAHRFNIFVKLDASDVVVEGRFAKGRRPRSGEVVVHDGSGKVVRKLALGNDGRARFPIGNPVGALRIVVAVGDGHDAERTISAGEIERHLGSLR